MKKQSRILLVFCAISSISSLPVESMSNARHEEKAISTIPVRVKKALVTKKEAWKKGLRAAIKKHRYKKPLNREERLFYKKFLQEVGGVAAVISLLAIMGGVAIKKLNEYPPSKFSLEQAQKMDADIWREELFKAARDNDVETLKTLLLALGDLKNIDAADRDGWTALMMACKRGNYEAVSLLLQNGASTQVSDESMKGFSPLMLAADEGHSAIIQLLLSPPYNVSTEEEDRWGRTAFMLAADRGHNDVVQIFLDKGVDINKKQKDYGTTALMWAVKGGNPDTVRLLLRHGADATIRATEGTALEIAKRLFEEQGRMGQEEYQQIIDELEKPR